MISTFDRDEDVLVFLCVPKTGSTSLSRMLSKAFHPSKIARLADRHCDSLDYGLMRAHDQFRRFGMRLVDDLRARAWRLRGRSDLIAEAQFLHGHHPIWAPLRNRRRRHYVTVMRDPVDRFISNYYYIRAKAEARSAAGAVGNEKLAVLKLSPDDFVAWILTRPVRRRLNGHCVFLARSGEFEDARDVLERDVRWAAMLDDLPNLNASVASFLEVEVPRVIRENVGTIRPSSNPLGSGAEKKLRDALEPDFRLCDYLSANRDRFLVC